MHSRSAIRTCRTLKPIDTQAFRPVVRAYVWTLLSVTAPRIIALLLAVIRRKKDWRKASRQVLATVRRQFAVDKVPTAFALLVAGATVLPRAIVTVLRCAPSKTRTAGLHWDPTRWHVLRLGCTFVAGLVSFALLNRRRKLGEKHIACADSAKNTQDAYRAVPDHEVIEAQDPTYHVDRSVPLAGRTIDLTFFGMVRATDICLRSLWSYFIPKRNSSHRALSAARTVDWLAGPTTFIASSSIIMWAWFYSPYNLPKAYQAWISSAAQLDERLLEALRQCRQGNFIYGRDTPENKILRPMCREIGLPEELGDASLCQKIPCQVVHCGTGDSCEWHALTRLARAFLFAMKTYVPINLLLLARRKPTLPKAKSAMREAARSSSFLGSFVALFYYGVCLARRRVGPKIFPQITGQQMDGGISVSVGTLLCGTSIFLEKRRRRQEFAFFVAPRALATAFPRRYDRKYIWREQVAYASCAAIILTAAVECPRQVRGVLGRLLQQLLV